MLKWTQFRFLICFYFCISLVLKWLNVGETLHNIRSVQCKYTVCTGSQPLLSIENQSPVKYAYSRDVLFQLGNTVKQSRGAFTPQQRVRSFVRKLGISRKRTRRRGLTWGVI